MHSIIPRVSGIATPIKSSRWNALLLKAISKHVTLSYADKIVSTTTVRKLFEHLKRKFNSPPDLRIQAKRNFIKCYLHFKNNCK